MPFWLHQIHPATAATLELGCPSIKILQIYPTIGTILDGYVELGTNLPQTSKEPQEVLLSKSKPVGFGLDRALLAH